MASPLLANVYLHYVFDLWAERWRRREAAGDMIVVRYADDVVLGFQHESDARRFLDAMRARFEEFALQLHPAKTRLIEFGRHAANRDEARPWANRRPSTSWGSPSSAAAAAGATFCSSGISRRDRVRAKLKEIKEELRRRMHRPIPGTRETGWRRLSEASSPTTPCPPTFMSLGKFRYRVVQLWLRALRRRSEKDGASWTRMTKLAGLPAETENPSHPWPSVRFAARHPR